MILVRLKPTIYDRTEEWRTFFERTPRTQWKLAWHTTIGEKKKKEVKYVGELNSSCIESTQHTYIAIKHTHDLTYGEEERKKHNTELQKTIAGLCLYLSSLTYLLCLPRSISL
jgi:hypothetical protein